MAKPISDNVSYVVEVQLNFKDMMKVAQRECVPLCKIKHKISKPVSLSDKLVKLIASQNGARKITGSIKLRHCYF